MSVALNSALQDCATLQRDFFCSLPVSDRGKPLQEVLQDMPSLSLAGVKPWTVHVTLRGGVAKEPASGLVANPNDFICL